MMRYLRAISKNRLHGAAVLRLDFNTEDKWRMESVVPTLRLLLHVKAKIVIVSHRGRPKGKKRALSLRNDAKALGGILKRKVQFIPHFRFSEINRMVALAAPESVFVLENIRFLKGEYDNNPKLARQLASLGDYYINDAFAASHRDDASVDAITRYLPSYGGLEFEREIEHLSRVMRRPRRPLVMVFGGGKAHDKLKVMRFFKGKADTFLVGGAPANTILRILGINIGDSVVDPHPGMAIREIIKFKNVILPIDYLVREKKILDVGQKTVRHFSKYLARARTVIWNGPMGFIEDGRYRKGTLALARAIVRNRKAFTVVGGGETVMFLKKYGLDRKFSFISTGGGAMLQFLSGEKLPGIEALKRTNPQRN
ncbi:MAG: phosphoglycerate kinase [Candidatus Liptonbacteria bacterium]|nr:phosphoglycerate kinase [Candidatus Liptonbacteria bacterium]